MGNAKESVERMAGKMAGLTYTELVNIIWGYEQKVIAGEKPTLRESERTAYAIGVMESVAEGLDNNDTKDLGLRAWRKNETD